MAKIKFSKFWYIVGALLAANIAVFILIRQSAGRDYVKLYVFDVGQGDAIYLRTPQGNDILIDGGPSDVVLGKLGRAMPFLDRTIEFMIVTHPHADHAAGLIEVLKRFKVRNVMFPEVEYNSATFQAFLKELEKKKVPIVRPKLGMRLFLDQSTVLDILYPLSGGFAKAPSDINDASVVARLSFGTSQALLTGDAGKDIEEVLLSLGVPLQAEVLKIGHHGSRHSTTEGFLQKVNPRYSVISVGKNRYGHPHEEVLGLFSEAGREVLRTDEQGDIVFLLFPDRVALVDK